MNKVFLMGRITHDLELHDSNGVSYCKGSIAVNRNRPDKNGEYIADFLDFVVFGKAAESLVQHCKKGDRILIEGSIETGSYLNKNNQNVKTFTIKAEHITFIDYKKDKQDANYQQQPVDKQPEYPDPVEKAFEIKDDDLPF